MSSEITLYERDGTPVLYISIINNFTIYTWDGTPIAFIIDNNLIYNFCGKHVAWFYNGNLYDLDGLILGHVKDTLRHSFPKFERMKGMKKLKRIRPLLSLRRFKPFFQSSYSDDSLYNYFEKMKNVHI